MGSLRSFLGLMGLLYAGNVAAQEVPVRSHEDAPESVPMSTLESAVEGVKANSQAMANVCNLTSWSITQQLDPEESGLTDETIQAMNSSATYYEGEGIRGLGTRLTQIHSDGTIVVTSIDDYDNAGRGFIFDGTPDVSTRKTLAPGEEIESPQINCESPNYLSELFDLSLGMEVPLELDGRRFYSSSVESIAATRRLQLEEIDRSSPSQIDLEKAIAGLRSESFALVCGEYVWDYEQILIRDPTGEKTEVLARAVYAETVGGEPKYFMVQVAQEVDDPSVADASIFHSVVALPNSEGFIDRIPDTVVKVLIPASNPNFDVLARRKGCFDDYSELVSRVERPPTEKDSTLLGSGVNLVKQVYAAKEGK